MRSPYFFVLIQYVHSQKLVFSLGLHYFCKVLGKKIRIIYDDGPYKDTD